MPTGRPKASFDPLTRDLIRYLTRVHDVYLPRRLIDFAADGERHVAFERACRETVGRLGKVESLHVGISAPLTAMLAVRAGASRATICERWPTLSAVYETIIAANGMTDSIRVVNKSLREAKPGEDIPEPPELMVVDGMGNGFDGGDLHFAVRYARKRLLSPGAEILPRSVSLYAIPMEMLTGSVCGFDLRRFNRYRWSPIHEEIRREDSKYGALADPVRCRTDDWMNPTVPESEDVAFSPNESGMWNAVVWWHDLFFDSDHRLSCAPSSDGSPDRVQYLQYLDVPVPVSPGQAYTIRIDSVRGRIRFSHDRDERDRGPGSDIRIRPALPHWHFPMIADRTRNRGYEAAVVRAVSRKPTARVLDVGTGTGLLAMMASRAGAERVTACEMTPHMASTAKDILKTNGFEGRIDLVAKSSFDLRIPGDMAEKANILVSETVDHSLLGEGFLAALVHARTSLLTEDPVVIPAEAIVSAAGVEIRTETVSGFDFSPVNHLRLNHYTGMDLSRTAYRRLTPVTEVFRFDFSQREFRPAQKAIEFEVLQKGTCNAVAFWYRLKLYDGIYIDTGPDSDTTAWQQAVVFLEREIPLHKGEVLPIVGHCNNNMLGFSLDAVGCLFNGIALDSDANPVWFDALMDEEKDFQAYTRQIDSRIDEAGYETANRALRNIVGRMDQLGFDPMIVSDFILQLGYHL